MTKTLTEQWRDGDLKDGWYYVTSKQFGMLIDRYRDQINDCGDEWRGFDNCQGIADEILAPVPSYDKWKQMIDGDKATIHHLKKILPTIEYNRVAYDYLKKVIEDMEEDIEEHSNSLEIDGIKKEVK